MNWRLIEEFNTKFSNGDSNDFKIIVQPRDICFDI